MASHRNPQRGATLLELLVGLTIGALVIGAAMASMLIARDAATSVSDMSQLQQQGAHAMRNIGIQVRQAGSLDLQLATAGGSATSTTASTASAASTPTVVEFIDGFVGLDGGAAFVDGVDGAGTKPDSFRVANLPAPLLAAQRFDCLGQEPGETGRIDATFAVEKGNLRCKSSTSQNQPLVEGVAGFRVRYRLQDEDKVRAMRASEIAKAQFWPGVTAVEVCLDLQGHERKDSGTYVNCDGQTVTRDGRLHVVLRNVFHLRTQSGA
ncbi:prepilin-type N-terminal cleavage/methylation domain-containing protein [Variovorax sp. J22R133]|uniref:PilW family protein n=1 Tax=Variovorax brevis TaxID=3053503 RepID=UPI002574A372|nr:prepilin-type N-terminal cleavage/methylation domain-containing protein [Variovorax sp. J22R133]MDM0112678.1 prepilin-type N-terminal cleavage/methylation domain-containing protein [Variovorax sp. J22R133]